MVIALCGALAETDPTPGSDLGQVLGCDPFDAAAFARRLIAEPHPLVATGAGLWVRGGMETAAMARWRLRCTWPRPAVGCWSPRSSPPMPLSRPAVC